MGRPTKSRVICSEPEINTFGPFNTNNGLYVYMSLEEYEVIRLIDFEGLNQEECAYFMGVARTTIQRIYDNARKKLAMALVGGKTIKIEGGNYILCNKKCNKINCCRFNIKKNC